jgi:anti-sigma B factor antagonist
MRLVHNTDDGFVVIRIDGELDHANIGALKDVLAAHLGEGQHNLLMDLEACTYLDGAGLAALFTFLKLTEQDGGMLSVAAPQPQLRRLFEIVGLLGSERVQVYDDITAARFALSSPV